jgi:4-diphosphocytidyl-2-C-methyl-D-erythritol kinase
MLVRRNGPELVIWTPAKLNLFLEVHARRSDGFHDIETVMTAVSLYDTLRFRPTESGQIEFSADWATGLTRYSPDDSAASLFPALPQGTDNLAVRALEMIRLAAKATAGAVVRLTKRIPLASGLGGGSSDAAAALVAANVGWNLGFPRSKLQLWGGRLGSDVPFFLHPSPALCQGRGECISPWPAPGRLHVVVVRPPDGLTTSEVYQRCRVPRHPQTLKEARDATGGRAGLGLRVFNRLEMAAADLTPWIGRLRYAFQALGVRQHQMTGSGSAYFGICASAADAMRIAARLRQSGWSNVFRASSTPGCMVLRG